ncbi:transporter, partial [Vibrio parahaemolyticus]|nr:transporter [Vibrio parahaemolyticus]
PKLMESEFVFCTVSGVLADYVDLNPVLMESEFVFCTVSKGISANVIAAYYHDHIFVQSGKAEAAVSALEEFSA